MNTRRNFDTVLLIVIIALCAFGILMVFSASYYSYQMKARSTGMSLVLKHSLHVIIGLSVMMVAMLFDYHIFNRLRIGRFGVIPTAMVLLSIALLVYVDTGRGQTLNGAGRWLTIAGFSVQPSEIARISLVFFVADQLSYYHDEICQRHSFHLFIRYAWPTFAAAGIILLLIFLGNALSMTAITGITFLILLWIADFNPRLIGIMGVGAVTAGGLAIGLSDFRRRRMMVFTNPWQDAQGSGYQLVQSLYALGNGGLFGVGIGNSRQKYQFLTYGDSDYILSIIGEEIGWVGLILLLLAYGLLIYRSLRTARSAPDRFGLLLATGITSILAVQLIINVLVVTSFMPPTGVPLPFISAGGSSLIIFLASMGVLLNISRYREQS